jgi:2-polyprenyl-3-methyl-5-hydroxy-6-metoxy-1,4-benzoquinol methylase
MNFEEEIFCLKYELDTFANYLTKSEHERWLHGFMSIGGENQHLNRFKFAKKFVETKMVLDTVAGGGYGAYFLAQEGNPLQIDSIDLDSDAIRYAKHRFQHEKLSQHVADAETFVKENHYDTIISFETVEHLPNYAKFLKNVYLSLKDEGTLVISTPIASKTTTENINPFHVIEWSFEDFHTLIKEKFSIEEIYLQSITLKKDLINTFPKRVLNKLFPNKYNKKFNPELIKYTNQYNAQDIDSGFQILVCKKNKML